MIELELSRDAGDSELALLDARSWGRHPVRLTLQAVVDHGLLLFASAATG